MTAEERKNFIENVPDGTVMIVLGINNSWLTDGEFELIRSCKYEGIKEGIVIDCTILISFNGIVYPFQSTDLTCEGLIAFEKMHPDADHFIDPFAAGVYFDQFAAADAIKRIAEMAKVDVKFTLGMLIH